MVKDILRCSWDRREVVKVVEAYTRELGWPIFDVAGLLEDAGNPSYLVHVTVPETCIECRKFNSQYRCNAPGECDCPKCQGFCNCSEPRHLAFLVEWTTLWEVTSEVEYSEYLTCSEEISRCSFCDRRIPRKDIVIGVCLSCHEEGIEA